MSTGVIDQIEHDALALVETVRIEQSEMEVRGRKVVGAQEEARREEAGAEEDARRECNAQGSVEGQVYFDVATILANFYRILIRANFPLMENPWQPWKPILKK